MANYKSRSQSFSSTGISLTHPVDRMPDGKYPFLKNVRANVVGTLQPRPGLERKGVGINSAGENHTIRRLNDELGVDDTWTRVVGTFTHIAVDQTSWSSSTSSGWGSNIPKAIFPERPVQSVRPWMYVSDSTKSRKFRVDGTEHKIGLSAPLAPPTPELQVGTLKEVDYFNDYLNTDKLDDVWSATNPAGTGSDLTLATRVNTTITAILYDNTETGLGWACVEPASIGSIVQGMILQFDPGESPEHPEESTRVHSVHPKSRPTTIEKIIYDSGSTGLCSITLVDPVNQIEEDSFVEIEGTGVRVLSVTKSSEGIKSFRCSTTVERIATNSVAAVESFRVYLTKEHASSEEILSKVLQNVFTGQSGTGKLTGILVKDLSQIGSSPAQPTQPTDELHISLKLSDASALTQGMIRLNVDATGTAFTQNYFWYAFRPYDLTPVIKDTATLLETQEDSIRNTLTEGPVFTDEQKTRLEEIDRMINDLQYGSGFFPGLDLTDPSGLFFVGGVPWNPEGSGTSGYVDPTDRAAAEQDLMNERKEIYEAGGAATQQLDPGDNQWVELAVKIRDLKRAGTDASLTLKDVNEVQLELKVTETALTVQVDSFGIAGGGGPDSGGLGLPYIYRYRGRSTLTGVAGNFSPACRTRADAHNQGIWVRLPAHPDYENDFDGSEVSASGDLQVDKLDVERFGGSILGWRYVGSARNAAESLSIASSTDANPISITTATDHGFRSGDQVYITGHDVNLSANGFFVVTRTGDTTFTLDGSVKTAEGGATGTVDPAFLDEQPDIAIAASPAPLNNRYQPWAIVDSPVSGVLTAGAGTTISGTNFNTSWAPGTIIRIGSHAYTIYRVISTSLLETVENVGSHADSHWEITAPVLTNQSLPAMWGPLAGHYFACGDSKNPGRLYFTNGNDPDSTTDINWIDVTSPSEPLQNGVVFNGRAYVFSTERMFAIHVAFGELSRFTVVEVPSGKGMASRHAIAVGPSIWYLSKDGIYETDGRESRSLTDKDLYSLFPHEGNLGVASNGISPPNIAYGQDNYLRLAYYDQYLYFDYQNTDSAHVTLLYSLLHGGWFYDEYDTIDEPYAPIMHYGEEGQGGAEGHNLLAGGQAPGGSLAPGIYQVTGTQDKGHSTNYDFVCQVRTPAYDEGDSRVRKLWGDCALDIDTAGAPVAVILGFDNYGRTDQGTIENKAPASGYPNFSTNIINTASRPVEDLPIVEVDEDARNLGLDISWASINTPTLYGWSRSWLDRPQDSELRPTDYQNAGSGGNKQFRGLVIEADTRGVSRSIQIQYDGNKVGPTLSIDHDGRLRVPYGFEPFEAHLVRLVPRDSDKWRIFSFDWVFDQKPESAALWSDWDIAEFPGPKFMQGVWLEVDTGGVTTNLDILTDGDDETVVTTLQVTHQGQVGVFYAFPFTFEAQSLRLRPDRSWKHFNTNWTFSRHPERSLHIHDWTDDNYPGAKFLQSVLIEADTGGEDALLRFEYDGRPLEDIIINHDGRREEPYSFSAPPIAHVFRPVPISGSIALYKITWVWTKKPEMTPMVGDWSDGGYPGSKFLQGILLEADTGSSPVNVLCEFDGGTKSLTLENVVHSTQMQIAYGFSNPPIVNTMRIIPSDQWRLFPSTRWIYTRKEDLALLEGDWEDAGVPSSKFMQGLILEADTNGSPLDIDIYYDGDNLGATLEIEHDGQRMEPYSFSNPFIARLLKVVPNGKWRRYSIQWIFEPAPELALTWNTPPMTHGLSGFQHLKYMYISHVSTSDISLVVTVDGVDQSALTVSSSGGIYAKTYLSVPVYKGKSYQYKFTSTEAFRLYKQDCEVSVGEWGRDKSYNLIRPFGGLSIVDGAKI